MEWIKCSERLPQTFHTVLCINEDNEMFVAEYRRYVAKNDPGYFDKWNSGHCCGREMGDAIYWMPLPEKPKT